MSIPHVCDFNCNCKPAATEHGTGSGDAHVPTHHCIKCGAEMVGKRNVCLNCDDDMLTRFTPDGVPTPPASPTVTLDRIDHAFESAISALAWLPQDGPIRKRTAEVVDELRAARQELALLRAAERQK